ncbi:voltage-gated potassium channel [Suillus brevipes Sb2]|nr:voltage-gated potassium channel [Suillus brevipes Sb2]
MTLNTLIALVFAFTSTGTRESDPEKGPETFNETSNGNRNLGTRAHNDDEEEADVEVDGLPPDESVSGLQNDSLQPPPVNSPDKHPSLFARAKSFIFPPSSDDLSYAPNYRYTPLITGIVIPFSILLEIPGLTGHWYIRTEDYNTVQTRPNPVLLDIGLAFSMTCAVLANICIILRFLEKRVMRMTVLCIVFLSIHDTINIVALIIFGVSHRFNDGFTYGESFWMTVCSTVVSVITNVTLIIDLICTPDFKTSGSGLTRKQRTLMIMLITLFAYIAFGSLVNSFLLSLSFINALYFTVTTIETIGFGDIAPDSPGSRVFICFYAALGIVNLAVVVGMVQETVREGLRIGYIRRLQDIRERRRASRRRKNAERRWRSAVIWRLRDKGAKVWVRQYRSTSNSLWAKVKRRFFSAADKLPHPLDPSRGKRLNLEALTHLELKAAAMEAGVPLDTLLPPQFYEAQMQNDDDNDNADDLEKIASTYPALSIPHSMYGMNVRRGAHGMLTHQRLGAMGALLTRFAIEVSLEHEGPIQHATVGDVKSPNDDSALYNKRDLSAGADCSVGGEYNAESSTTLATTSSSDDINDSMVANMERHALLIRSSLAWTLFVVFWLVGSAIFSLTEGWSYGLSIYFCFVSFTTIGYGDPAPRTPAGRSVFVVWALLGVATVTVLISVASEAYSKRYKAMLQSDSFERAVTMYRTRTKKTYMTRTRSLSEPQPQSEVQSLTQIQTPPLTPASPNVRFQPHVPSSSGLRLRTFSLEQDNDGGEGSWQPRDREVNAPDPNLRVQDLLETLPRHVLNEARSFQEHMRYLGDSDSSTNAYVNARLKALLDDVVGVDDMKESVKMDILRDRDTRQTLVTLNIEKSLMDLMTIAEEAIAAMNERDRVAAASGQGREDADIDVGG